MTSPVLGAVAAIGLGHVGIHYARHLINAGAEVWAYDIDEACLARAVDVGAHAAHSCREAAEHASTIVVSVPDPSAIRSVLLGDEGVFAGAAEGALVIDASTGDPETARAMYAEAKTRGIDYLETPISGGEPASGGTDGAAAGNVTFMVGGDEAAFERAKPVLETLGAFPLYLGPSGSGSVVKLVSNHVAGLVNLIVGEAFTLGAAAGFGYETLLEVFAHTDANSYMMSEYIAPRLRRNDFEAGFSVDLMYKDHLLADDLAKSLGVPLPFNQLALNSYQRLHDRGLGHKDVTEINPFLACEAGVTIEARTPSQNR